MPHRRVRIGCTFTYVAEIDTPVIFQVKPRAAADVTTDHERWASEPHMLIREYEDLYGNPCVRAVLPAGRSTFGYEGVAVVPDAEEDADENAPESAASALPDDTLIYTLPSRYCLPDALGNEAWSRFGGLPPGYRPARRQVRALSLPAGRPFPLPGAGPRSPRRRAERILQTRAGRHRACRAASP